MSFCVNAGLATGLLGVEGGVVSGVINRLRV
jgi:hypothetical protein